MSASADYIDEDGKVVDDTQYRKLKDFGFRKTVKAPRHEERQTSLRLSREIDTIVRQAGGDAVTYARIEATNYDAGSHGPAAGLKVFGWTFTLAGGLLLGTAAGIDDAPKDSLVAGGAVLVGAGLVSLLLSSTKKEPSRWQFKVSGDIVKATEATEAPRQEQSRSAAPPQTAHAAR